MGRSMNIGFDMIIEERKMLSFFKFFQSSDLSSECMRAFSYNFISSLSRKDFSDKMVIRAHWGKTWHLGISKNPRYYYIEKRGWDQFVSDNALGENEFITFTHRGNMVFHINIYEQNGVEMLTPRKFQTMDSSSGIKKEGESSFKDVKKEEETDESAGRAEFIVRKRKTEESKSSKKKMERKKVKNGVETGESSRGSELKARKKKAEGYNTSKKKKSKSNSMSKEVLNGVPEFKVTICKSYLQFLAIPIHFVDGHMPIKSNFFTVRHPNGIGSWKVLCLVRENQTTFSSGYAKLAREYPLMVGDKCTFKLIKPFEFVLLTSKKTRELNGVPEFKITICKSHLNFLSIPAHFWDAHMPIKSTFFTVRHPNGIGSWKVLCLVKNRATFSRGYPKLAREYPLMVGDKCTFKLIKPFEFVLLTSKKTREDIDHYMID